MKRSYFEKNLKKNQKIFKNSQKPKKKQTNYCNSLYKKKREIRNNLNSSFVTDNKLFSKTIN